MFCKFCGSNIEDDSQFCPICGRNLNEKVNSFCFSRILVTIPNIIMIILFFLPWITLNPQIIKSLGIFGLGKLADVVKLSPYKLIEFVDKITQLPFLTVPSSYKLVYFLLLIPVFSIITIILVLINKKAYKIFSLINLVYTFLCCILLFINIVFNQELSTFINLGIVFYLTMIFAIIQFVVCILYNPNKTIISHKNFNNKMNQIGTKRNKVFNYIKEDINKRDKYQISLLIYCGLIIIATLIYFLKPVFYNYMDYTNPIDNVISPIILIIVGFYIYYKFEFKLSDKVLSSIEIIRNELFNITERLNKFDDKIDIIIYIAITFKILISLFNNNIDIINSGFISLFEIVLIIILLVSLVRAFSIRNDKIIINCLFLICLNQFIIMFKSLFVTYWYLNIVSMTKLLIYWIIVILYHKNMQIVNNNN